MKDLSHIENQIHYVTNFQDFVSGIFPTSLTINAFQKKVKTTIIIDYNSKTFNEDLSFPYNVPDGYDRIFIK